MAAQETVVLNGHIIDSLILAKVLDTILMWLVSSSSSLPLCSLAHSPS